MITQGKLQYVHLSQFPDHEGEFTIQCYVNIMAPFKMAAQMLPWGLRTFGKSLLPYSPSGLVSRDQICCLVGKPHPTQSSGLAPTLGIKGLTKGRHMPD